MPLQDIKFPDIMQDYCSFLYILHNVLPCQQSICIAIDFVTQEANCMLIVDQPLRTAGRVTHRLYRVNVMKENKSWYS